MESEARKVKESSRRNSSKPSTISSSVGLAQSSGLSSLPKVTKPRRPRKKSVRATKKTVNLNSGQSSSTPSSTLANPDSNGNNVEQIGPREPTLQENSIGAVGDETKETGTESTQMALDNITSSTGQPNERQPLTNQQPIPCTMSTSGIDISCLADEATPFLLPICERKTNPRRKSRPQTSGIAQSSGISDEPTTFILPLGDGPPLQCQSMMSGPAPGVSSSGYPMEIVHFGPPPHLVQMGQYFGHPPMVPQFQSQPTPIARIMGPQPAMGHFVGAPHQMGNFLRPQTPTNPYFRPAFWDPHNPYQNTHPYASPMVPTQMQFPGAFPLRPKRKRPTKPSKPRKQRRGTKAAPNSPESGAHDDQNTVPTNVSEHSPHELEETCPNNETLTVDETFPQMVDKSSQEKIMDDCFPPRKHMIESFPQETITDDDSIQETIIDETIFPQEAVITLSADVPDMCIEVEVESTRSLNGEEGSLQNEDDEEEMEERNFSWRSSKNAILQDLHHFYDNQQVPPRLARSCTHVKTRRLSHKKDHKKLVFDRKSEAMVKAAKGLFTKRTRTLYTWLYPNTSKREVKVSVSKAWDLLPDSEKAYYLAQVDGRLGIHPGLMVNPQLEGLVKLPEGSTPFKPRPRRAADDSSEDAFSSDDDEDDNETAKAVRSLFASSGDVDTWASFTQQQADKKAFRRRKKRPYSDTSDNERYRVTADVVERTERLEDVADAELEGELAKFRQILENDDCLDDDDSYWRVMPEPDPNELFLDIV